MRKPSEQEEKKLERVYRARAHEEGELV